MKCLSGKGIIKIEMENDKICNYDKNQENFYGFKDYSPFFSELFMNRVGYTETNGQYSVFKQLVDKKEDFISLYCSFPKKEDLLLGLSDIMLDKFDYLSGGGYQNGPKQDKNNPEIVGFDCTRLVMFLIDKVSDFKFNFTIGSDALYQEAVNNNYLKSKEERKIGDVIFYKNITTGKVFHCGVLVSNEEKIHVGQTGKKVKKAVAIYQKPDVEILFADFININKENTTEEHYVQGFTGTEVDTSSEAKEIMDIDAFSQQIKINLFVLLGFILFL
jgi:hypothetical protein